MSDEAFNKEETRTPETLFQIRRTLDSSRDMAELEQAARRLLPYLWSPVPWRRYRAQCILTSRLFLPYGMHPMEWISFPRAFARALRRLGYRAMPPTHELRREAVAMTLRRMLGDWLHIQRADSTDMRTGMRYNGGIFRGFGVKPGMDIGADICEAIGRLGIHEAERELLSILNHYGFQNNSARMAALAALAALPPQRLELLWNGLRQGDDLTRRRLAATLAYMFQPEAVPYLLETLSFQTRLFLEDIGRPILLALGTIGDLRAFPKLNEIALSADHPLRPTARLAIRRLMKVAEGHDEVTLVRASDASTLQVDDLLRPAASSANDVHPDELLRPTDADAAL
jgi:HEAT repeat protein